MYRYSEVYPYYLSHSITAVTNPNAMNLRGNSIGKSFQSIKNQPMRLIEGMI
jgi:hypothetical protein